MNFSDVATFLRDDFQHYAERTQEEIDYFATTYTFYLVQLEDLELFEQCEELHQSLCIVFNAYGLSDLEARDLINTNINEQRNLQLHNE
jgi:hypothetical protein